MSSLIGRVGKADQRVFCMKKLRERVDAQYISRRETLANKQVIHIDGKNLAALLPRLFATVSSEKNVRRERSNEVLVH